VLTETQTITSTIRVPDRGTMVLGGLSTLSETTGQGSVPILSHIPILKVLATDRAVDKRRTHLLFMVTPTIMLPNEIEP
jgi:type II secretory pathway component GspD/PulD (secretin)